MQPKIITSDYMPKIAPNDAICKPSYQPSKYITLTSSMGKIKKPLSNKQKRAREKSRKAKLSRKYNRK
jgi:hypothetical protein